MRKSQHEGVGVSRGDLAAAVAAFLAHRHRRRLAPGTLSGNRLVLRRFLGYCRRRGLTTPHQITPALADAFMVYLRRDYQCAGWARGRRLAPSSITGTVHLVCGLFRFLAREGWLLLDPMRHLVAKGHSRLELEREVKPAELAAMVRACPDTPLGDRNRAILEVLFGCGLRRAELVGLDLYDLELAAGTLLVRHGKGDKTRLVPLAGQARRAVRDYLDTVRPQLITSATGPALFLSSAGRRLSNGRLHQIVKECAAAAGISRVISAHGLRHGYALALLRNGADVYSVQRLLGHDRVDTTEHYTTLTVDDLAAVHARTHPRERDRS